MYNVMFICTANICRTPMAEYLMSETLKTKGLDRFVKVQSAGTWAVEGTPVAPLSQSVCAENGVDSSRHRARPISLNLIQKTDLVLCMSEEHKDDLVQIFPHFRHKIFTLIGYQNNTPKGIVSIPDPYGKDISKYRKVFQLISKEINRILPIIVKNAKGNND